MVGVANCCTPGKDKVYKRTDCHAPMALAKTEVRGGRIAASGCALLAKTGGNCGLAKTKESKLYHGNTQNMRCAYENHSQNHSL